jgi:hypothetical protein
MSLAPPSPAGQIAFLGHVERLLSEGQFTATYKYALLVALADLAVRHGHDHGDTLDLAVADVGERFIELYWRQALPYGHAVRDGDAETLVQNTGRQAAILGIVEQVRAHHPSLGAARASARWATAVKGATRLVEEMPLWKLQRLRGGTLEFLYGASPLPHHVRLLPGVAANLRRFHGLVVRLAQSEWLRFIQSLPANAAILGPTTDLERFLFGGERGALARLRPPLRDLQHGDCFYCGRPLDAGEVDHFIPWSRYPRDLSHNFVLAHGTCNRRKSDLLAARRHLERWLRRNADHSATVGEAGVAAGLLADLPETTRVAAWAYAQAETLGATTWVDADELEPIGSAWRAAFPARDLA